MTKEAELNPRFLVLSGDHGYALFDEIIQRCPSQFINAGVMEQAMIGIAAGLTKVGYRTLIYGLSSFVPIRVLEQIKLDFCYPKLPAIFLGDGAGLVYSTLGVSHQCAEDIACLRPLPNIRIYSPCDAEELKACFTESMKYDGPSYIRLGKADRSPVHTREIYSTDPRFTLEPELGKRVSVCFVASGSMVSIAHHLAVQFRVPCVSVPRLKPVTESVVNILSPFKTLLTFEEHSRFGGLTSSLADAFCQAGVNPPRIYDYTLKDQFSDLCGSYQYALSEHGLSDEQLSISVTKILSSIM
jgi:transketolase